MKLQWATHDQRKRWINDTQFLRIMLSTRIVVVVVTRPLSMDNGMAEDHGALEAIQFSRA